jgi:hypothetical protein
MVDYLDFKTSSPSPLDHNNLASPTEYFLEIMDHQNTGPTDSNPAKSSGKPLPNEQTEQNKTEEAHHFYTHRKPSSNP